jgi:competence protein ComGC
MMRKRPLLRVGIREQLAAFGLLLVLIGLAIVSIPTWLFVHNLVTNVKKQDLAQTAAIKASQITSQLDLIESTCATISSRYNIQRALIGVFNDTTRTAERKDTAVGYTSFLDCFIIVLFSSSFHWHLLIQDRPFSRLTGSLLSHLPGDEVWTLIFEISMSRLKPPA